MPTKPTKEQLSDILKLHTNIEAAKILNAGVRTVQRWRDSYGLSQESVHTNNAELTQNQKDLLTAWMLGDGCIPYVNVSRNNRFAFKQKIDRKEYVQFVYNHLLPYSISINDDQPKPGPKKVENLIIQGVGPICYSTRMMTIAAKVFSEMRKNWYQDPYKKYSQKIVPEDININWQIFAYWFADDGNNNSIRKTITLFTQSFTENDVDRLVELIKKSLNIEASKKMLNGQPIITIGAHYYEQVMDQLNKYLNHLPCLASKLIIKKSNYETYCASLSEDIINEIWKDKKECNLTHQEICKKYNISSSTLFRILKKKSVVEGISYPKNRKVSDTLILEIIELWNNGESQSSISKKYNLSQTLISQIVNRKIHQQSTKFIYIKGHTPKGTANVHVIYSPKSPKSS